MPKLPSCEDYEISIDTARLIKSDIRICGKISRYYHSICRRFLYCFSILFKDWGKMCSAVLDSQCV